jgi:hypothetical protein
MKDAFGHGSNGRGGSVNSRLRRPDIGLTQAARFSGRILNPNPAPTEGQRAVNDLRNRLSNAAGPGHAAALVQGIRNLTPVQAENAPFQSRLSPRAGHSFLDPHDPRAPRFNGGHFAGGLGKFKS